MLALDDEASCKEFRDENEAQPSSLGVQKGIMKVTRYFERSRDESNELGSVCKTTEAS